MASYPVADWAVSGRSTEEFIRRQNADDDPLAYADEVYRRHLRER